MRFSPPPSLAPARRSSRVSRISFICFRPPLGRFEGLLTRPFPNRKRPFRHLVPPPGNPHICVPIRGTRMTDTASTEASGAVTGGLRKLLRLEGLALFIGMTLLFYFWGGVWVGFTLLC